MSYQSTREFALARIEEQERTVALSLNDLKGKFDRLADWVASSRARLTAEMANPTLRYDIDPAEAWECTNRIVDLRGEIRWAQEDILATRKWLAENSD
jgi:hypothetical protein